MRLIAASLLTLFSSVAAADPFDAEALELDEAHPFEGFTRHDLQSMDELSPLGESVPLKRGEAFDPQGIVNGTVVGAYEYPNVVALAGFDNWGGFIFCSGSLIDPEWVLTAAHCIEDLGNYDLVVLFGGDIINEGYTDAIDFASTHPHPDYDGQQFINDIGLVRLASPKNGVDLVVLNDEPVSDSWYGTDLTILGYGVTTDGAYDAGTKRVTEIPIVWHDNQYVYTDAPNTNVCQGDSGGPAFETTTTGDLEQVGVNAFVTPGCVGGSAGLTRVDQYIPWIQDFVPNVIIEGSGVGSGGEEPSEEEPTSDPAEVDAMDPSEIDRDLGDAPRPNGYPLGVRCSTTPSGAAVGWLVALALLASGRRSRPRGRRMAHRYNA